MEKKDSTKGIGDSNQAMWVKEPKTGQVRRELDENGAVRVRIENPGFAGTPYCVRLGLGMDKSGSLGHSGADNHFFAEVHKDGSFDIDLKAYSLRNRAVTIVWSAIPLNSIWFGDFHTLGPTPIPTLPPIGLTRIHFRESDFPGRPLHEVDGIEEGSKVAQVLTESRIDSLAALASANAKRVAQILGISEVKAVGFIYEARQKLLEGTP